MFGPDTIATLAIQGAGLAFFAGIYVATIKNHSKRLDKVEESSEVHDREIGTLWHVPSLGPREVRR